MERIESILENKQLQIGKLYVYIEGHGNNVKIVEHVKAVFQNEQHEKDYLSAQGAIYMLKDLETDKQFDLHGLDYIEYRYKIYPITERNLGFILMEREFRINKTNQRILLKHFYSNL